MAIQIKDPALPAITFESDLKAIVEKGSAGSATLHKVVIGSGAVATVGTAEGNLLALGVGGAIPPSLLSGREGLHAVDTWATSSRTLALTDDRRHLRATHATPVLSIPLQATVAFPGNYMLTGTAASGMTITAVSGVTLNGADGGSFTVPAISLGGGFVLWKIDANAWEATSGAGAVGTAAAWPVVVVTGSSRTIAAGDNLTILRYEGAGPMDFVLSSDLGADFQCGIINAGTGQPTFSASGGQTLVTDGTSPLRMKPGLAGATVLRSKANTYDILGLDSTGATATVATASDLWTASPGLIIATPEVIDLADVEQLTTSAISITGSNIAINGAYGFNMRLNLATGSSGVFADIDNMTSRERRVRIKNETGGSFAITADAAFVTANFDAGISIPDDKFGAFVIEDDGTDTIITFAGYED